ncbi:hypothetical protein [Streptomyces albidus (ex Kaewkla and Franco 2022)]|uniref:hypothetical protein n=1 Tax=Streptomyces albidus (ex Kaewkla and Franco 2022) TaxID=722709 RepID=UPI0015EECD46|nr:hypothetical protein [Streptomyces albidus (ex Kaewkla and Franco 2022)]
MRKAVGFAEEFKVHTAEVGIVTACLRGDDFGRRSPELAAVDALSRPLQILLVEFMI